MSTGLSAAKEKAAKGTRFDREAWLTLAGVGVFALVVLITTLVVLALPGDGWQMPYPLGLESPPLEHFMGDWGTPLRAGDVVTAVDGTKVGGQNQLSRLKPPSNWRAGGTVVYTVQRDEQTLDVPVTLHRLSLAGIVRGLWWQMQDSPAEWGWSLIALAVFLLRPRDPAARLLLIIGVPHSAVTKLGWAATTVNLNFVPPLVFYSQLISSMFWGVFWGAIILLVLSFPVRVWPLTRWPRAVPVILFGLAVSMALLSIILQDPAPGTVMLVVDALLLFAAFGAAIINALRRSRDAVARAQTLWLVFGLLVSIGVLLPIYLLEYGGILTVDGSVNSLFSVATALGLPVALGIAITRYRLFDIDIIIRKTLVYAILTGLLALIYFGSVVLLQTVFAGAAGEQSPVAIVLSTLIIAALFSPMRRRVQDVIDRRFYRRKYDAQQVLARFAQTARDETNLERLTADLLSVISDTVQPSTITLWANEDRKRT